MTTTLTLGPNAWPLSIKATMTAEGVTLLVQSNDWREAVTISQTRAETLAVLREAIAAVEALQCGYGWGCTDLECTEHGAGLRTGDVLSAPPVRVGLLGQGLRGGSVRSADSPEDDYLASRSRDEIREERELAATLALARRWEVPASAYDPNSPEPVPVVRCKFCTGGIDRDGDVCVNCWGSGKEQ